MPETKMSQELLSNDFIQACCDYAYLLNRKFPERGVLKLVGDRYRLSGDQRTVLYRGISSQQRSALRRSLLVSAIAGKYLVIDGYNVLFTLLNYRLGRITFISTDQLLRDAGSLHGKLRDQRTFGECVGLLADYLVLKKPSRTDVFFDAPVSHSEKHALLLRESLQKRQLTGDCYVIKSADWALRHTSQGVLATSDTAIIETAKMPVIDLPRGILEYYFHPVFPLLESLIKL